MFDYGSKFLYFNRLIKDFNIKPVLTTIKNPQANYLVELVFKLILDILVTKVVYNTTFDYIYPWGKTIAYIAWEIRASYHHTIETTTGQYVFGRDIIFQITSVVDYNC